MTVRSLTHRDEISLDVNGETRRVLVGPADTLLYTLRNQLGLTGAKPGCENGDCGACTVVVDGAPMKSCLMLAAEAEGAEVETVEGLQESPAQAAFLEHWAFQCGYCTSGFLMLTHALATAHPNADEARRIEWLRSNICRCTGYEEIVEAVKMAVEVESTEKAPKAPPLHAASPR
jgi:carbon-monoxide dehydrogenase small subunit